MSRSSSGSTWPALLGTILVGALVAAGCGGSPSDSTTGGAASEPGAGVAHAQAELARFTGTVDDFEPPGPPLDGVETLGGKTVFYIPITLQASTFVTTRNALEEALGEAGVTVVSCSADGTPSGAAKCLNQAMVEKADGVIADAVPIGLAATAFEKVQQRGIPILVSNQVLPPPGAPGAVQGLGDSKLGYLSSDGVTDMLRLAADWVIADSDGDANVLIVRYAHSESAKARVDDGAVPEFEQHCPGCEVEIIDVTVANSSLIPSQTSAAILRNPSIDYILVEFDSALQGVFDGVQETGAATRVKGVSTTATLGGLQMLKDERFLAAEIAWNFPYQAWAQADSIIRQMLGAAPVQARVPIRLLTYDNIDSVALTPEAEASGEWTGGSGYEKMFTELWGL